MMDGEGDVVFGSGYICIILFYGINWEVQIDFGECFDYQEVFIVWFDLICEFGCVVVGICYCYFGLLMVIVLDSCQ